MAKNIWALLPTKVEGGGIWQQVTALPALPFIPGETNIWNILGNQPGGLWQELSSETILLNRPKRTGVWSEVNDETLIIRPRKDIWLELARTPLQPFGDGGIWREAAEQTLILDRPRANVWSIATQSASFKQYKPVRRLGWALKKLRAANSQEYYILKNMRAGTYLRLSEEQVFLWNLMDGQHTVQDMAVAYFIKYKSLAIQGLLLFLGQLEAKGFLIDQHTNMYARTAAALGQGRSRMMALKIINIFTQKTFSVRGIDSLLTKIYRSVAFLAFTLPVRIMMLLITLSGFVVFIYQILAGTYSVLTGGGEQLWLGLVMLYAAQFLAIFLHEASHAFACKHYHREVRRAGFMIYLGMPAFFVDTTDIWMEPRKPRMLVSWAGPYSGFFLGGTASLLTLVIPDPFVTGLLYQFAFSCIFLSFTNLNPLLLLDGYYILMDWLEIPMLRARAMRFVQGDLWKKLRKGEKLDRDEKIYTLYGVLSLAWTVIAVVATLLLLGKSLVEYLQSLLGADWGLVVFIVLIVGLAALLLWPFLHGLLRRGRAASAVG